MEKTAYCPICKKIFILHVFGKGRVQKTCSKVCAYKLISIDRKGKKPKNFEHFQTFKKNKLGTHQTPEERARRSEIARKAGIVPPHYQGKFHPMWRGGITTLGDKIKNSQKYLHWRKEVFERDSYTCIQCGDKRGHNLEADHIIPRGLILRFFKIKTMGEALNCKLLWDINNGRTLCKGCHKKTPHWGKKFLTFLKDCEGDIEKARNLSIISL